MMIPEIKYCPSLLKPGYSTYCPSAQSLLFGSRSKKVLPVLPFSAPGKNAMQTKIYNEKRKRISISGVQEKYSLRLEKNELLLTDTGGTHLIKPIPAERLEFVDDLPANEHVSMQMASQVFNIPTAACGMIFFDEGEPAYITRRFDYKPDGVSKYQMEDFATLLAKTPEREGQDFKYNASYLDIVHQIQQHTAAKTVVLLRFFKLLLFNYLIGNGDAHLKNFALMETTEGDYILSPAYDLLCTAIHIDDSKLALHGGLYEKDYEEESFARTGTYTASSFMVFARLAGIAATIAATEIHQLLERVPAGIELIQRSFLSEPAKEKYIALIRERARCFQMK